MKKFLCVILMMFLAVPTFAYVPEKTHVFQSGAVIRASELNQNEDDFFNALNDGNSYLKVDTVSANSFYYNSTVTRYKYVSFAEFYGANYSVSTNYSGASSAAGRGKATAQVLLPNGATITQLYLDSSGCVTANLVKQTASSGATASICAATATSNSTACSSVVDNSTYQYLVVLDYLATTGKFYRVKVTYTTNVLGVSY